MAKHSIVAISDMHGALTDVPECDLLVIGGDICPATDHTIAYQLNWLDTEYRRWLKSVPAKRIVGVAGNHDFVFESEAARVKALDLPWTCLENEETLIDGVKIFGTPFQMWFYDWAFNAPQAGGERFLERIYSKITPGTDIIISHGPPFGGDPAYPHSADKTTAGVHTGSKSLLRKMLEIKPKLLVTGHIHEGYSQTQIGRTLLVNASILDENYVRANEPVRVDI